MRHAKGVHCPYNRAGVCGNPTRSLISTEDMLALVDEIAKAQDGLTEATSDLLAKEEVKKFGRWISEPSFLDLNGGPLGADMNMSRGDISADGTDAYIAATTKPCPVCGYRATHFHGHSCHHTLEGCPACHTQYCYKCLATEHENVTQRGLRPKCLCGGWSNFCKSSDILQHLVLEPYPFDKV